MTPDDDEKKHLHDNYTRAISTSPHLRALRLDSRALSLPTSRTQESLLRLRQLACDAAKLPVLRSQVSRADSLMIGFWSRNFVSLQTSVDTSTTWRPSRIVAASVTLSVRVVRQVGCGSQVHTIGSKRRSCVGSLAKRPRTAVPQYTSH